MKAVARSFLIGFKQYFIYSKRGDIKPLTIIGGAVLANGRYLRGFHSRSLFNAASEKNNRKELKKKSVPVR